MPTCSRAACDGSSGPKNAKALGAEIRGSASGAALLGTQTVRQFGVFNDDGDGVLVEMDSATPVFFSQHGLRDTYYTSELQVGRAEIPLTVPTSTEEVLRYSFVP